MAIKIQLVRDVENCPPFKEYKESVIGFSWTTFFFGPIPSVLRGDWFNAILLIVIYMLTELAVALSVLIFVDTNYLYYTMVTALLFRVAVWVAVAANINRAYNRKLAKTWHLDWDETKKMNNYDYYDESPLRGQLTRLGFYFT